MGFVYGNGKRVKGKLLVAGIVIVCIIAGVGVLYNNRVIEMPDCVGVTVQEAVDILCEEGFPEENIILQKDDGQVEVSMTRVESFFVISQSINCGERINIKEQSVKFICTDLEGKYSKMLVGKGLREAKRLIEQEGYSAEFVDDTIYEHYEAEDIEKKIQSSDYIVREVSELDYAGRRIKVIIHSAEMERQKRFMSKAVE